MLALFIAFGLGYFVGGATCFLVLALGAYASAKDEDDE